MSSPIPVCDECGLELHRFHDAETGLEGWSCDVCGWSWDDEDRKKEKK